MHKTEDTVIDPNALPEPVATEPSVPYGPRLHAPRIYIGETICRRATVPPDVERYKNGALPGKRDKLARRMIRKAFKWSLSTIEQKILKARDVRLEVERLATNGHEARRYFDKVLAVHPPAPAFVSRSEARAKQRAARRAR